MRMEFPSSMPLHEQLIRSSQRKQVGRKHNHTAGPSKKAAKRQRQQVSRQVKRTAAWRKYTEQVAMYFQGFRDTMPQRPDAG